MNPDSELAAVAEFNLIDEPWIPVVDLEGKQRDVSIREALASAHRFRDLAPDLPTMRFALLRLLESFVYRVLDDERDESGGYAEDFWGDLWRSETLPVEPIDDYLEEWRHRFNLVDTEAPFMQVPDLRTAKDEWKPLSLIVADVEPDKPLFTMRSELDSLSLAEAARWLVHANAYDYSGIKSGAVGDSRVKGGRGYPMGIGWCGWMGGIALTGRTLQETLLLNYVASREDDSLDDLPIWEHPVLGPHERGFDQVGVTGPIALMTWPQRRFRLRIEGDKVTAVLVTNGDALDYTTQHKTELMTGWRFSQPQSTKAKSARYMARELHAGQALWRGLSTLLPQGDSARLDKKVAEKWNVSDAALPAATISWLGRLTKLRAIPADYLVEVSTAGMEYGAQSSSFAATISDRLAFAAALAELDSDNALLEVAHDAVRRSEGAVRALGNLARDLNRAAGGTGDGAAEDPSAAAYAELGQQFQEWLLQLRPGANAPQLLQQWTEDTRRTVRRHADRLIHAAPPTAWVGRTDSMTGRVISVATAARGFDYGVFQALGNRPKQDHTDGDQTEAKEEDAKDGD